MSKKVQSTQEIQKRLTELQNNLELSEKENTRLRKRCHELEMQCHSALNDVCFLKETIRIFVK